MNGNEHQSFFRPGKFLAFLPLVLLAAAVFWHAGIRGGGEDAEGTAGPLQTEGVFAEPKAAKAPAKAPEDIRALNIQGSPEFRRQAGAALELIRGTDPKAYSFIRERLYLIRNENRTGFYMENRMPVAAVSSEHAFRSLPWCAGVIAHQAFHSYVRSGSEKKRGFTPPPPGTSKELRVEANPVAVEASNLDSVLETERRASEFQARVLSAAGGSRAELGRLRNRAPRDFSAAHDGDYSPDP